MNCQYGHHSKVLQKLLVGGKGNNIIYLLKPPLWSLQVSIKISLNEEAPSRYSAPDS